MPCIENQLSITGESMELSGESSVDIDKAVWLSTYLSTYLQVRVV